MEQVVTVSDHWLDPQSGLTQERPLAAMNNAGLMAES
jgi:hypothetical protein